MQGRRTKRTHRVGPTSAGHYSAAIETLEERRMLAQAPELLADLSGNEYRPEQPPEFAEVGDLFFFNAGRNADQLWRSDGTAEGTFQIKLPGSEYPYWPRDLYEVRGKLFFTAYDGTQGRKLWVSDGTVEGTHVIPKAGLPTSPGNFRRVETATSSFVVFTSTNNERNRELWRSDGTAGGTHLLKALTTGFYSNISELQVVGDRAYFTTYVDGPVRLWQTYGTVSSTIETHVPLANAQAPAAIWHHAGLQYFLVNDGTRYNVWRSNGTAAGTQVIAQLPTTISLELPLEAETLAGDLFFVGRTSANGKELFKFDLETATFSIVADFHPGEGDSSPNNLTAVGDTLYFLASYATGSELIWRTDGTMAGTTTIGYSDEGNLYTGASRLMNFGGTLLFHGLDAAHGMAKPELWKSDGTDAGTVLIKDINPGQPGLQFGAYGVANGRLFFVDYTNPEGFALRVTDGTAEGTELVKVLSPNSIFDVNPVDYLRVGTTIYITTDSGVWAIPDGGSAVRLTNHRSHGLVEAGGQVYFLMIIDGLVRHVMVTDGTVAGTRSVRFRGPSNRAGYSIAEFQGRLYFTEDHDLWTSDGTPEGTQLIKDIPSSRASGYSYITKVSDKLFFTAGGGSYSHNDELWVSDGTTEGTKEIEVPGLATVGQFRTIGDALYFTTYNPTDGEEQWVSDGTVAGTHKIEAVPMEKITFGGKQYYLASDGTGEALWTTDGTEAGTQVVVPAGSAESAFRELLVSGETLYFEKRNSPGEAFGLWAIKADQTEAELLLDLTTGDKFIRDLTDFNGVLYFILDESGGWAELWRSGGTTESTERVPGVDMKFSGYPARLTNVGGSLIFFAEGPTGRDPWILRASEVLDRHLFYNDSAFDGGSPAANAADDGAIATDKSAYLPGSGRSTTAGVSSYVHGINGIMIDIAGLEGELTAEDFIFRIGMTGSPESWAAAPEPLEIVVRGGAGTGGSDRVTITWANGAIKNTWLQVTVKGYDAVGGYNTHTGLTESDTFFFGSRVGDTFTGATPWATTTNIQDELTARFSSNAACEVTNIVDFNRDGMVNIADQLIARMNAGVLLMLDIDDLAETLLVDGDHAGDLRAELAFALAIGDDDAEGGEHMYDAWRSRKL